MRVVLLSNKIYRDFLIEYIEKMPKEYRPHEIVFLSTPPVDFDRFTNLKYDVGVSFMYPYKVPAKQINSHTWINFHPGPLPEYKGRNLCYHAIMNGEKEFGATVHYMDENFDTGDIIWVERFPIWSYWTAKDLSNMAIEQSKALFREYFPRILAGEKFKRKSNRGGNYYRKAIIPDTINFVQGFLPVFVLERHIRATYYPPHYPKIDIGGVIYKIVKDE